MTMDDAKTLRINEQVIWGNQTIGEIDMMFSAVS
jgi:hypothetical protein